MPCLEGGEVIGWNELALGSGLSKQVRDSQAGVKAGKEVGAECVKAGRGGAECVKARRGGAKL